VRDASTRVGNLAYEGFLQPEQVSAQLASARLAVVPSRWQEPAGLVALEAMAAGTPVIAYASGGLAEYVRDGDAGLVVAPDVAELAASSRALYDDAEAWGAFSARALGAATANHSLECYVRRLVDLYREAMTGQGTT
jgi:glycosyltransferase involved in cell wall biosynthesis